MDGFDFCGFAMRLLAIGSPLRDTAAALDGRKRGGGRFLGASYSVQSADPNKCNALIGWKFWVSQTGMPKMMRERGRASEYPRSLQTYYDRERYAAVGMEFDACTKSLHSGGGEAQSIIV